MWWRFYSPDDLHILLASSEPADTRTQAQVLSAFAGAFLSCGLSQAQQGRGWYFPLGASTRPGG